MGWDAAWTPNGSGGWCVVSEEEAGWELLHLGVTPRGESAMADELGALLDRWRPERIAIDMPVGNRPVTGYREADRATTRAFSRFGCPVHSPTPERPGAWGGFCMRRLLIHGYACKVDVGPPGRDVIEVYPHTAVLMMLRLKRRYPYKIQRAAKYWPEAGSTERKRRILNNLRRLHGRLAEDIRLPEFGTLVPGERVADLKATEDLLDALVCAWAAIQSLSGVFVPYGDAEAAVWNPGLKELDGPPAIH